MTKQLRKYICFENEEEYLEISLNSIYKQSFSIESIYEACNYSKIEILKYLVKLRLIKNRMICEAFTSYMNLVKCKSIDGYAWICHNHTSRCQNPVHASSFFENMRKSLKTIFLFMYYWSKKNIKEDIGREIRINKNTMTGWSYLLREVFQTMFLFADIKLGGVNEKGVHRVVEIDESYL
jgi:hypothetical protein